jgi:hypothetical protein
MMDLKKIFGDKYMVTLDESWESETPENRTEFLAKGKEVWYYEIKGRRGTIYPYSDTHIAVVLPTRSARRLVNLMGSELILLQHADDAMCFKADVQHTNALIRFIKPKRMRKTRGMHAAGRESAGNRNTISLSCLACLTPLDPVL